MQNVSRVDVYAVDKHVGTLAEYERGLIASEYSQKWLESGFPLVRFHCHWRRSCLFHHQKNWETSLVYLMILFLMDGADCLLTDICV